jgi:translocation and assembly module TamB
LVFGRFSNTGSTNNSFVPTTGFLTAQLSSLVSTKNFDLNLANGVGGSLRLFNDRITIDGTINTASSSTTTTTTQTATASAITGDVNIEYKISKDGRFKAKGFQRNDNSSDVLKRGTNQLEQGVGLFYRIEFDTFGELYRKLFKKAKKN